MGTPRSGYIDKTEVPLDQRFKAAGLHTIISRRNQIKPTELSTVYYDGILRFDHDTSSWETYILGKFKWRRHTVIRRRRLFSFLTYRTTEYQLTWEVLFVPRSEGSVVSSEVVYYNVEPKRFVRFFRNNQSVDFMWSEKRNGWELVRMHLLRID